MKKEETMLQIMNNAVKEGAFKKDAVKKIEENIRETISFSFDELEITGIIGDKIYLYGHITQYSDVLSIEGIFDKIPCILQISKYVFKQAFDLYMNDKQKTFEQNKNLSGKISSLIAKKYREIEPMLEELTDDDGVITQGQIRTFQILSFETVN
jgi:hypothetical protein